ncbi:MAG TPA: carbonic anhydrase [Bacteroidales bacterium]|nr:carbonic anhydrase [Bacteroidales bacterium]
MSNVFDEIQRANNAYAAGFGTKKDLSMPPARKTAILTCMDARLDPAKFAGLVEGDAHVIRNAGGRASDDAIRSLIISHKLLGTGHWLVIHHTDCGMETFNNEIMGKLLSESLVTATIDKDGWKNQVKSRGSLEGKYINWLTISNQKQSVLEDVNRIRNHPLVNKDVIVRGFIYDVRTGILTEISGE